MGELLGLGLTHYPPLLGEDQDMSWVLKWTLEDEGIPDAAKNPASWPAHMRREWAEDEGRAAAAAHRAALMEGFDTVAAALDDFAPDVVIIFGDDQYENFTEDLIPPFAVLAYDDMDVQPWMSEKRRRGGNAWNEPADFTFRVPGRPDIGRHVAKGLIEGGFDMPYAYRPLHHEGLSHSFLNALLLLDHRRRGLPYGVLPISVNCYGSSVVSRRGTLSRFGAAPEPDPPGPNPERCMQLGAAVAEIALASPWRVAVVASSSWSHAFLTDHTWRLHPDMHQDRMLYDAFVAGDTGPWREQSTADLERSGQQEMLNWYCLVGAMEPYGVKPAWSSLVETHAFNSNKVFAVYPRLSAQH